MGLTEVRVGNPADESKSAELEFLVGPGAVYRVAPGEVLSNLGIAPPSKISDRQLHIVGISGTGGV